MAGFKKYREYFDIDENFFPTVNEEIINTMDDNLWKKFYPHETFVNLLNSVESVLSRKQKLSIWVEGSYGTGKSHAVLTLKKLLDASRGDTEEYFNQFPEIFKNKDLFNKLQGAKEQGRILTIHRYGSSEITSDHDLIIAIQDSVEKALIQAGIENKGDEAQKDAIIAWLSDEKNKKYFNDLLSSSTDNVDGLLNKLQTYEGRDLVGLIRKIIKVGEGRNIKPLMFDKDTLIAWLKCVITQNELKAIVFIWDEFTNYFQNNMRSFSGFQKVIELSNTHPFYFVIVTHKSEGLFHEADKDKKLILDRFIKPTCIIDLPENMAFKLIGQALQKKADPEVKKEWDDVSEDLNGQLHDTREQVMTQVKIGEDDLKGILPIHPYAALLLKHLSATFDSNQRSMFDFIKNNRGEDIKAFQWFIDNASPFEDNTRFLTIDMLWDFFYEKGKSNLSTDVRLILETYNRQKTELLEEKYKRVLKTVLLLQAISHKVGDDVALFVPNEKNLDNAFDGTDFSLGEASSIANRLVKENVLFKKMIGGNKYQFSALININDQDAIEDARKKLEDKKTEDLIQEGGFEDCLSLGGSLKARYYLRIASADKLKNVYNEIRNRDLSNRIPAVLCFAKDDNESIALHKLISEISDKREFDIIFIDTSSTVLGRDAFDQYLDLMAQSHCQFKGDKEQARQFSSEALKVLEKWKDKIYKGEFIITCNFMNFKARRIPNIDDLISEMKKAVLIKYPESLETFINAIDDMYVKSNSLGVGAECGMKQETRSTFRSANDATKLENALAGAWRKEEYWKVNSGLKISKIKSAIESFINKEFAVKGRVSIDAVYDKLKDAPYGFLPCNLTAFILGFLLKEYANSSFGWSDGDVPDKMNEEKLQSMIVDVINQQNTTNARYKKKFIVVRTEKERAFEKGTSIIFDLNQQDCAAERLRESIRSKLKSLLFPIWTLKEIISELSIETDTVIMLKLIDLYVAIANNGNSGGRTETEIVEEIGEIFIDNDNAAKDLKDLVIEENLKKGMIVYASKLTSDKFFEIAKEISITTDELIILLHKKFDASAANWVWNQEEANRKIHELLTECDIVIESNKYLSLQAKSYERTISDWCDKLGTLKISFDAIKYDLDELRPIFEMLYVIKRTGGLKPENRSNFLSLLKVSGGSLVDALTRNNQIKYFKSSCSHYLAGLEEHIDEIFKRLESGMFTKEKGEYYVYIEEQITKYKRNLGKDKLRQLWLSKTGTSSPRDWSQQNKTPILCMVDPQLSGKANKVFAVFSKGNPDELEINDAITFLENSNFWNDLMCEDKRNLAFRKVIVKNYATLLPNADDVRALLFERASTDVYDWVFDQSVENIICKAAESEYVKTGSKMVLSAIDELDPSDAKRYLKLLAQDNMLVGIEIIKDKKL